MQPDAIVLGAGPSGQAAAIEAAKNGLDVLLLPNAGRRSEGWLHTIPAPRHFVREFVVQWLASKHLREPDRDHVRLTDSNLDPVWSRWRGLASTRIAALHERLKQHGISVDLRRARFEAPDRVRIERDGVRSAALVVIATGSRPRRPARFHFDGRVVCDADSVFRARSVPRNLLVVGAEAPGCELACIFAALGSAVTIVDRRSRTLRYVDRDLLKVLHERMQAAGIDLVLDEWIHTIDVGSASCEPHATVRLSSGRVETCDRLVVLAGREGNTDGLGLEAARVEVDEAGFVIADESLRTSAPGVFASGGVVASLGHDADVHQGRAAVRTALGLTTGTAQASPITIHTIPEVSMVGINEEMCEKLDQPHVVGTARYADLPAGLIRGDERGTLKLVAAPDSGQILGVQAVGAAASEVIHVGAAALNAGRTLADMADSIFHVPSFSQAYAVAAAHALDRVASATGAEPSGSEAPG